MFQLQSSGSYLSLLPCSFFLGILLVGIPLDAPGFEEMIPSRTHEKNALSLRNPVDLLLSQTANFSELEPEPLKLTSANNSHSPVLPPTGKPDRELGITVIGAWDSRYMWKGFKVLDSGVYKNAVDLSLWDTGLHLKFMGAYPSHSRNKSLLAGRVPPPLEDVLERGGISLDRSDIDAFQYAIAWKGKIGDCIDVELGSDYYDLFKLDSQKGDFLETHGVFTLSKLPLSPHFGAYYAWPYNDSKKGEGWMTDIGITQPIPLPACPALGTPAGLLLLSADLWYNGGAWSGKVDPGWAYAEFKALLPIPLRQNMTLIPGITYQASIEDTVDSSDEIYATVALEYKW